MRDRAEKRGHWCESAQNSGSFSTFVFEIFAAICNIFHNLTISPENFDWKNKNLWSLVDKL